ncbi:hypothetical protein M6D93_15135 [Jatrophihabitans telluris]|uniref:Uncharacterized protein n=1 Tax=Jatrophihabitans telluris TaxID=2038343 RepID=A0ABY4QVU2_9ACTN|nr:hypothetical protein [Jatrophihabitans telluris]UQX87625.1 hypothetical protein M6D93_15135 [Jatrophihabitans telluris]
MPTNAVEASARLFTRAPQHRLPRNGDPGYVDVAPLAVVPPHPSPGDFYSVELPAAPITWPDATHPLTFGFWAARDDGGWYEALSSPAPFAGRAGATPETDVRAWFCDFNGGGPGPSHPYLMLDELYLNTGALLDDPDFVTDVTDPSLNTQANTDGWIATDHGLTLRAAASFGGVQPYEFYGWQIIGSGVSVPLADRTRLDVSAGAYGIALAVYASPTVTTIPDLRYRFRDVSTDEAVLLMAAVRNGLGAGPIGQVLSQLASDELIRSMTASMTADNAVAVGQILDQDAAAAMNAALKALTSTK